MKKYSKLIIAAIIALIFIGTFVFLWQKSQPKEVVYNEFTPPIFAAATPATPPAPMSRTFFITFLLFGHYTIFTAPACGG